MRRDTKMRTGTISVVAFASLAWALASCRDATRPTEAAERPPRISGSVQLIAVDSGWDYYSADMELIAESDNGFGPSVVRSLYHVERNLDVNDVWTTSTLVDPEGTFGPIPAGAIDNAIIARVVSREDGSTPMLYDRSGAIVSLQLPDTTELPRVPGAYPPGSDTVAPWPSGIGSGQLRSSVSAASGIRPASALAMGAITAPRGDPRAWLDAIVITPAARSRNAERFQQRFGLARERVGDLDRYTESRGKDTREIFVDPVIGVAVEERISENGVLKVNRTHTFARLEGGGFVRTATRLEIPRGGRRGNMILRKMASNVRVARRGTRP